MKEIDARGLACRAPVLQTKTAIEAEQLNTVRTSKNRRTIDFKFWFVESA